MSVYAYTSYAPKSTVPSSKVFSTASSSLTKQRTIVFETEWYWYPEGVKTVKDRLKATLAEIDLVAECDWDEPFKRFRLRCRISDATPIAQAFQNVLATIIKQELKKGYKAPWIAQEDEASDEQKQHYRNLLERLEEEEEEEQEELVDDDEEEALELDVDEKLNSRLIRRLKLYEDKLRATAQITSMADLNTRVPVAEAKDYPALIEPMAFKCKWLGFFHHPLELEKAFSDQVLAQLKLLTSCDFSKCIRTGILFIGSDVELNLQNTKRKLDNLKIINQLKPYLGHVLYAEGTDKLHYVFQRTMNIRKDYFATTLMDNMHLAVDSDDRKDGELLPVWGKVSNAVTIRGAVDEKGSGIYEAIRKLDIPDIPTSKEASFKDWIGFEYNSTNERSYLRQYIDLSTGGLLLYPIPHVTPAGPPTASAMPESMSSNTIGQESNGIPRSTSSNTIRNGHSGILRSISENAIGQGHHASTPRPVAKLDLMPPVNGSMPTSMLIEQWQAGQEPVHDKAHAQSFENDTPRPSWDTYNEIDLEQVMRNRLAKLRATSKVLQDSVAPMGFHATENREGPATHQPANPSVQSTSPILAAATQLENTTILNQDQDLLDLDSTYSASSIGAPASLENRAILDDDISMVSFDDSRPQPARYVFTGSIIDAFEEEDLISLTPPELLVDLTSNPVNLTSNPNLAELGALLQSASNDLEQLQTENEVDSRIFHATMNQKAGARQKSVKSIAPKNNRRLPLPSPPRAKVARVKDDAEDPSSYFINDMTGIFTKLLGAIRFFRGPVEVQLEFGRILLTDCPPNWIWQKSGDNVYPHTQMIAKLDGSREQTSFTKVLSLVPQEMEFLIKMKNKEGQSLWQPSSVKEPKWTVTYEIHYRDLKTLDASHPFLTVMVDGETFKTQIAIPKVVGETCVHGVLRHWDYRIAAACYESIDPADSKIQSLHRAIKKTFCVPHREVTPKFLWEMETDLTERFQLVECVVKRTKKYAGYSASGNGGVELNITEMISLDVDAQEMAQRGSCIFLAAPSSFDRHPTEKLTNWWEASISSTELDQMMEEHTTLPLGEEAKWVGDYNDPKFADIVKALHYPACLMLKQMDGVGQNNRNGIVRNDIPEAPKPSKKKPTAPEDVGFW